MERLEGTLAAEFGTDASNTKFSTMLANYKQAYGADMPFQSYGQTEYDAVYLVRDAINAVGYDGQKIAGWSRQINNWQGASGSVTIQQNGDPTSGHRPEIIKGGQVLPYVQQ
jgi:ABC-type branched-subunit amino acid transport system substrate-binding protein